ncbi:MAG TPA: double-strand break repair protein AddB [Azospirillaceae bacterium]|nr:double-strand break repair protein AddB [Azospirillaceae bacterium]
MTAPAVYTVPPGVPFADALAVGILDQVGGDPLALASFTVLLPMKRACRTLREAFLRRTAGKPLLLPRMMTLGEPDADELMLNADELSGLADRLDLPEPLRKERRQLLLTRAIMAKGVRGTTWDKAAHLAMDLGRLLDQVQTAGLGFERLVGLVPEDYAEHWQKTLEFLTILTEAWPVILSAEGAMDAVARRNALLKAQAEAWEAKPPPGRIIAAGSTGSVPASANLLRVVANLPNGALVLPGLDTWSDDATWQAVDPAHPQFNLSNLLQRLGIERSQVKAWPANVPGTLPTRARLIAEAMRPAATTEGWREMEAGTFTLDDLKGLGRIDCPGSQEEATVVALLMRQALEIPEKTAALVTPDRNLARRVAMVLKRWGIEVDDSGGRPLADTARGTFLRLTADFAYHRAEPLILLTLCKHPMAAGGRDPVEFRVLARALERAILRGPRPGAGFAGLIAALMEADDKRFDGTASRADLLAWVADFQAMAQPVLDALAGEAPFVELLRLHIAFAEKLAASCDQTGPERLWRHDDGEAAATFVAALKEAAADFPVVPGCDYAQLFQALIDAKSVRTHYGLHPRLFILGPMEVRMHHADLMILGGLNEGTWPPEPPVDPWMSRPMRASFGLPAPESFIGLSAHDFAQGCGAPEVVFTRAIRVDGTPTVPSRWLLRLDTVLRAAGLDGVLDAEAPVWLGWAKALDTPAAVRPAAPPRPCPPVAARPRKLSVTEIETWMRDPYAVYAKHVLGLRKLDPIAADPGASERGQFIHKALDDFVRAYPSVLPGNALEELLRFGREAFGDALAQPEVWAFWWPRFERIAGWFVDTERERRHTTKPVATEIGGHLDLPGHAGPFRLTAKADRIDRLPDQRLMIIDYKTGQPPSSTEVQLGFAPQLPLEAAMAEAGGFTDIAPAAVGALAFWRLTGGDPPGEEKRPVKEDAISTLSAQARAGLEALIAAFDDPATPYWSQPRPDRAPRYTDYAHLARVPEWSAGGGGGE